MTIDQLRYLLEISHSRSMTQASKNLHISHQALSASVNALEKELNTALVEKTYRGSRLTLKGKQLVEISSDFLTALDEIFLKKDPPQKITPFHIASSYLAITNFLAQRFQNIVSLPSHYMPSYLEYSCNNDIITAIDNNIADIGFCAIFLQPDQNWQEIFQKLSYQYPNLEFREVATLKIYCEVSHTHPLSYLEAIPLSKLEKFSLLYFFPRLSSQELEDSLVGQNCNSVYLFTNYFRHFDFSIESNPSFYYQSLETRHAIGISIAESADSIYNFLRIPLQSNHHFKIISVSKTNSLINFL